MAKKSAQIPMFSLPSKNKVSFGGSQLLSHPKKARPVSTKSSMHVVLKSDQAKGALSLLRYERAIQERIKKQAARFYIKIYGLVVHSNHIHLHLKLRERKSLGRFLKATGGLIVRIVLKKERSKAGKVARCGRDASDGSKATRAQEDQIKSGLFFTGRPFTRILDGGKKSFQILNDYLKLNDLEKMGFSKEESRKRGFLKQPKQVWAPRWVQ